MIRLWSRSLLGAACLATSGLWSQEPSVAEPKPPAPAGAPAKPAAPPSDEDYRPGPDSQRQPGVPSGKTFQFALAGSKIFPGTTRSITVYVPAQYRAEKPACVYLGLDGLGFNAPVVFDNLIHKREMPLVIGVGISPGQVSSSDPPADPRFNRSFEFDGLNDNLARCVLEEILPEVEKRKTPDGLPILLSKDPNDRCVGGGSTGGIGAFTLAWERPDAFRRVFTAIGTFVGMRGGDRYPVLIRKTEPKPLRIFMQDGEHDQWGGGPEVGDWWNGNQGVERALEFAGYQVEHVWGHGSHSGRHATAIFPDAMRWLWKDWPLPIEAGQSQNLFQKAILAPGETWRLVATDHAVNGSLACKSSGDVFYHDAASAVWRHGLDSSAGPFSIDFPAGPLAFGPERTYLAEAAGTKLLAFDFDKQGAVRVEIDVHARDLFVTHTGHAYVTEGAPNGEASGKVWLVKPSGEKTLLDESLRHPTGVAVSPDGLWLAVAERDTHWANSYRVAPDGTVSDKQRFYWFHIPDWADDSGAEALRFDRDGRLYAATRMGVQVFDRNGRSRAILPVPGGPVTSLCFGGEKFDMLYVIADGKLFKRKLKVSGVAPAAAPIKLPGWGAG